MLRLVIIFWLGASLICNAWASEDLSEKPIIDEDFKAVEMEIKENSKSCREKGKNTLQIIGCKKAIKEKYQKEGKVRGTDEYCKKHYENLTFDELRNVWKNLKQQRHIARITPDEKIVGEVTEGMFMVEEFWVESRLAKLQKERTAAIEKKVFGKTEQGRAQ